jgi:hypothetical protein
MTVRKGDESRLSALLEMIQGGRYVAPLRGHGPLTCVHAAYSVRQCGGGCTPLDLHLPSSLLLLSRQLFILTVPARLKTGDSTVLAVSSSGRLHRSIQWKCFESDSRLGLRIGWYHPGVQNTQVQRVGHCKVMKMWHTWRVCSQDLLSLSAAPTATGRATHRHSAGRIGYSLTVGRRVQIGQSPMALPGRRISRQPPLSQTHMASDYEPLSPPVADTAVRGHYQIGSERIRSAAVRAVP